MAPSPKEYTRLAGRGRRRQGFGLIAASRAVYTLWMGRDHVLLVERNGYSENYKRFYFTDVQAVITRRTSSATIFGAVTGGLALLFALWALSVSNFPGRLSLWIIAGSFALFCLVNVWRGPSCVTHLKTAVQTEQIPSWGRVRATRRGMAQLRPRLQEAQGVVAPDELKAQWMAARAAPTPNPAPEAS